VYLDQSTGCYLFRMRHLLCAIFHPREHNDSTAKITKTKENGPQPWKRRWRPVAATVTMLVPPPLKLFRYQRRRYWIVCRALNCLLLQSQVSCCNLNPRYNMKDDYRDGCAYDIMKSPWKPVLQYIVGSFQTASIFCGCFPRFAPYIKGPFTLITKHTDNSFATEMLERSQCDFPWTCDCWRALRRFCQQSFPVAIHYYDVQYCTVLCISLTRCFGWCCHDGRELKSCLLCYNTTTTHKTKN
jgi:hypothetical protein